jgi:microcystin-dependent protein
MSLSREIVGNRFIFNMVKGQNYQRNDYVGELRWFAQNNTIPGWQICDGTALDRTDYSELFTAIGTSFGTTSCSDFQVPDCRGRVHGMVGPGGGLTNRTLGERKGQETYQIQANDLPPHSHPHNSTADLGLSKHTGQNTMNGDINPGAEPDLYEKPTQLQIGNNVTANNPIDLFQPTLFIGNLYIYHGVWRETQNHIDGPKDIDY